MVKSHVVDNETGKSKDSDIRTSTGTFFAKGEDEIIARIEKRVAQVTMIPMGKSSERGNCSPDLRCCMPGVSTF
jgi:hypothetical protein